MDDIENYWVFWFLCLREIRRTWVHLVEFFA